MRPVVWTEHRLPRALSFDGKLILVSDALTPFRQQHEPGGARYAVVGESARREDGVGPVGRAGFGVCGLDEVEEYCVWKLLHERTPDFHRECGQVYADFWDAGTMEEEMVVFYELGMIHECQFEP